MGAEPIRLEARHRSARMLRTAMGGAIADFSIREWQLRSPTATLGKSFETHGPIGPWLTTADEIQDVSALRIRTWVNGELRQDGVTADMIHSIGQQLVELTRSTTLEAGDLISTGTPAGVGLAQTPPKFLKAGDVVRVEIDGLGFIQNRCVTEPS